MHQKQCGADEDAGTYRLIRVVKLCMWLPVAMFAKAPRQGGETLET